LSGVQSSEGIKVEALCRTGSAPSSAWPTVKETVTPAGYMRSAS